MANILNNILFEQKQGEFRALGARMDRFREDYVQAVNDVIAQLNLTADLSSSVSFINGTDGSIGIDDRYRYPVSQLVSLRLFEVGQRPARGGDAFYAGLLRDKQEYVDMVRQGVASALSDSDADDDTTDIVGLGAIG